ncbi:hypothetical protein PanWU01x14_366220, partial [Parasponia andersonii]
MCHGMREWHFVVVEHVRRLRGSEIHKGDPGGESSAKTEILLMFIVSIVYIGIYMVANLI